MVLYLDNQTRPYLERLVKNIKETDFIGKRLQGMLEADRERLETISTCAHKQGKYKGTRIGCVHCEQISKQSWVLQDGK